MSATCVAVAKDPQDPVAPYLTRLRLSKAQRALLAVLVVWAISSLWWPYGPDQAQLAWVGKEVVSGKVLYSDIWDNNPPGAILQHALLDWLFGPVMWPSRLLDVLYLVLTGWALRVIGRVLGSPRGGAWAGLFYVLIYASHGYGPSCQRDGWAAMQVTWAIALIAGSPTLLRVGAAGALLAVASLFKPPFALFIPALLPLALSVGGRAGASAAYGRLVTYAVAIAAVFGGILWWLGREGALSAAFEQLVLFNRRAYGSEFFPLRSAPLAVLERLPELLPVLIMAAAGAASLHAHQHVRRRRFITILWPSTAAIVVLVQYRFFTHHWYAFLISAVLLAGIGLEALFATVQTAPSGSRRTWNYVIAITLVGLLLKPCLFVGRDLQVWFQEVVLHRDCATYLAQFPEVEDQRQAALHINSHTLRGDTIQVWGLVPLVNLLCDRTGATRFGHTVYTFSRFNESLNPALFRRYRIEFLRGLRQSQPKYIVIADAARHPRRGNWFRSLDEMPEVERYISSRYSYETRFGDVLLFRAK